MFKPDLIPSTGRLAPGWSEALGAAAADVTIASAVLHEISEFPSRPVGGRGLAVALLSLWHRLKAANGWFAATAVAGLALILHWQAGRISRGYGGASAWPNGGGRW